MHHLFMSEVLELGPHYCSIKLSLCHTFAAAMLNIVYWDRGM